MERPRMKASKARRCSCGRAAISWLNDGTPMCRECVLKYMLALLRCGMPVTMAVDGEPDMVLMPPNPYRDQN